MANLKTIPLLFPVAVVVECDMAVSFPIFCFDGDGRDFAKALEDLAH